MTIRTDSYGSVDEVKAYTRHLLGGEAGFTTETRPSLIDVEAFIDRSSGVLNVAILGAGFTPAAITANSTAKLSCDDWVVTKAAMMVELTQRMTGYSGEDDSRIAGFANMSMDAKEYVDLLSGGWKQLGITVSLSQSEGLAFTADEPRADRSDPDNTSREQPLFRRRLWDNN